MRVYTLSERLLHPPKSVLHSRKTKEVKAVDTLGE